jgi:hypothetical protein
MLSRDRGPAIGLFALLAILWLGFFIHRSPRFVGSAWGGFFGLTAAILMLAPLLYTVVKRNRALLSRYARRHSFRTLLQAHVYLGLIGAAFAIVHSGHKFESVLGVALTTAMLVVVLSGFVGQYYLRYLADDMRAKQTELEILFRAMEVRTRAVASGPLEDSVSRSAPSDLLELAGAAGDLQYSVQFETRLRKLCGFWLGAHIVAAIIFYGLLALHVWAGLYFGLRWFA